MYEIVDGRHRFFAATELGLTSVPARVFPKETELTLLLKTGYNSNVINEALVKTTLYDKLMCIDRVRDLLISRRVAADPALAGKYKPSMDELSLCISDFNKDFSRGSVAHYSQIMRFGPKVMEIIRDDSAKLEGHLINKSNAYKDGKVAQSLGIDKRKKNLTPSDYYAAEKYFEALSQGYEHPKSSKRIPYSGSKALLLAELIKKRVDMEHSLKSRQDQLSEEAFSNIQSAIWDGVFDREADFIKVLDRSASHRTTVVEESESEESEAEVVTQVAMDVDVQPPTDTEVTVEVEASQSTELPTQPAVQESRAEILTDDFLTADLHSLGLFDLILTDPPYNVLNDPRDSLTDDERTRAFDRMVALLKPHGAVIIVS